MAATAIIKIRLLSGAEIECTVTAKKIEDIHKSAREIAQTGWSSVLGDCGIYRPGERIREVEVI